MSGILVGFGARGFVATGVGVLSKDTAAKIAAQHIIMKDSRMLNRTNGHGVGMFSFAYWEFAVVVCSLDSSPNTGIPALDDMVKIDRGREVAGLGCTVQRKVKINEGHKARGCAILSLPHMQSFVALHRDGMLLLVRSDSSSEGLHKRGMVTVSTGGGRVVIVRNDYWTDNNQ